MTLDGEKGMSDTNEKRAEGKEMSLFHEQLYSWIL